MSAVIAMRPSASVLVVVEQDAGIKRPQAGNREIGQGNDWCVARVLFYNNKYAGLGRIGKRKTGLHEIAEQVG